MAESDRPVDDAAPGTTESAGSSGGSDLARAALAAARSRARAGGADSARRGRANRSSRERGGDPQLFAAAVEELVTARGWQVPAAVVGVLDRWPQIVGEAIAARTQPESFLDGVLTVRASSTAWASQLRLVAADIVRSLNVELGHGTVTRLDVRGPTGPTWSHGPLRVRDGRGPRDTYG